jgi:hypothetical protein
MICRDTCNGDLRVLVLIVDGGSCMTQELYFSEHAGAAGVTTVAAYQLWSEAHDEPVWRDIVPHFRHLSERELQPFGMSGEHWNPTCYKQSIMRAALPCASSLLQASANTRMAGASQL